MNTLAHLLTILIICYSVHSYSARSLSHTHNGPRKRLSDQKQPHEKLTEQRLFDQKLNHQQHLDPLKDFLRNAKFQILNDMLLNRRRALSTASLDFETEIVEHTQMPDNSNSDTNNKVLIGQLYASRRTKRHSIDHEKDIVENYVERTSNTDAEETNNKSEERFVTDKREVDASVERYMKNFLFDMITLFQYEIKHIATKESHVSQHQRKPKHRKPSSRPKRNIRALLEDSHIKDILMKYFQQKDEGEDGKALFRFG